MDESERAFFILLFSRIENLVSQLLWLSIHSDSHSADFLYKVSLNSLTAYHEHIRDAKAGLGQCDLNF